jgi:hypothetical protein
MRTSPRLAALAALAVLALGSLPGCLFESLSPTATLNDQIRDLNEESRWGRLDLAVRRVSPRYRPAFMRSRRSWGRHISVADVEVMDISIDPDSEEATSAVELSWYDQREMVLYTTVVAQRWEKTGEGYLLREESIESGDATLLELPREGEGTSGADDEGDADDDEAEPSAGGEDEPEITASAALTDG